MKIKTLISALLLTNAINAYADNSKIIGAYLGADSQWQLSAAQQAQLKESLQHVTRVYYAFIRLNADHSLNVTADDLNNLTIIKNDAPDKPIILSVGGWGGRDEYGFLADKMQRQSFVQSAFMTIQNLRAQGFNVIGLDVDWENEQLASVAETQGVASLLQELHQVFQAKNFIVTNAVPASPAYWSNYPSAKYWANAVESTTIMAYDHYGTFGPTAELGAGLYRPDENNLNAYPYKQTSGGDAVKYYQAQALPANKIVLGVPFYCHSYYVAVNDGAGALHHAVFDPNISSQVDYSQAVAQYGDQLFQYPAYHNNQVFAYYGAIPVDSSMAPDMKRFMSCENPNTINIKMNYIKDHQLAGTSFWSLMQDVPYQDNRSLLRAMNSV